MWIVSATSRDDLRSKRVMTIFFDPWAYYAAEHEHVWREFAADYLQRAGASELLAQNDDGKRVFASRL
ncbi:hypothetical protein [Haladaptatus pallidirubidus]|uniref:hypothetical protein n=1 Tax=Haladaptatus pallidirubidus TaxID=1008152 RepID=UPI001D0F8F5B|nr:hypothetical protein [Haladaptatus pallidirubidus]